MTPLSKKAPATALHWFRKDLRLEDNPALFEAARLGTLLPVYVLCEGYPGQRPLGAASRWWLHHSLAALNESLSGRLALYAGDPREIIPRLIGEHGVRSFFFNASPEPSEWALEKEVLERVKGMGVDVRKHHSALLWAPTQILTQEGTPYRVFTPFYEKGCKGAPLPRLPIEKPQHLNLIKTDTSLPLPALSLLPNHPWPDALGPHWVIGEAGGTRALDAFLEKGLALYNDGRNVPSLPAVSRLSPHLHFGEISPHRVFHTVAMAAQGKQTDCFLRELGWREFSHYLLWHFPDFPTKNWQKKFDHFPWAQDEHALTLWKKGKTGYPLVDAGMRELWQTGYIHNRVRMVVASFLVKNLLIDWREGERWFWDCLVDASLANNSVSWQWVAGSGADAAPYFRIFNPTTQGETHDPTGAYTKRFVPELSALPDRYLFKPWQAPPHLLHKAGVVLGKTYPLPMVDLRSSRDRALMAFKML